MTSLVEQLKTVREINRLRTEEVDQLRKAAEELRKAADVARIEKNDTYIQFADLKQRLFSSERSNEFMRGYLARVAEDDIVREELIERGDPNGERELVPKRKPTGFPRADDFTYPAQSLGTREGYIDHDERRRRAKCWINY